MADRSGRELPIQADFVADSGWRCPRATAWPSGCKEIDGEDGVTVEAC